MLKRFRYAVFGAALAGLLTSGFTTGAAAQDEASALFKAKCSACHGADGRGNPAAEKKLDIPDLRSKDVQSLSDEVLFQTIAYGARHKEAPHAFVYRGVPEQDVRMLVKYIRRLAAPEKSAPARQRPAKAKGH